MSAHKSSRGSNKNNKSGQRSALSSNLKTDRFPAIDMRTITDVPTLTCVELSRSIIKRPEVDTGKLFTAISASNHEINKSDTVIVLTAAILESIGNKKAAQSMLNKSRTVTEFFRAMNLDQPKIRDSFVIMLFAIAPEFVKMIESSVKTSLERIQEVTSAPHADQKLLEATGELAREGTITVREHSNLLEDLADLKINTNLDFRIGDRPTSIQKTPSDGIDADDSISTAGKKAIVKDRSPMNTLGMMRYLKSRKSPISDKIYEEFPTAQRPIQITGSNTRSGLGSRTAESAILDNVSESNFTTAMNGMLNPVLPNRRPTVNKEVGKLYKRPVSFEYSGTLAEEIATTREELDESIAMKPENMVTREDITEHNRKSTIGKEGRSPVITAEESEEDASYLLDLL